MLKPNKKIVKNPKTVQKNISSKISPRKTLKGFNTKLESRIRELEEKIRNEQDKEHAIYIDGYGNILFDSDKAGCEASKCRLYTTDDDYWALLSAVAIHSHPVFIRAGYYWGSSFSPEDIVNGMGNNFNEIRFCDKYYTGILTRDGKYWRNDWNKNWNTTTKNLIDDELKKYETQYKRQMQQGKIKLSDYLPNYAHYAMEDFARRHGLNYHRELRHPLPPVPDFSKTLDEDVRKAFPNILLK